MRLSVRLCPRICSHLGTLVLALSLASPALAAGKKKKAAPSAEETSDEATDKGADTDSLMEQAVDSDKKKKDKQKGEPAAEEAPKPAADEEPLPSDQPGEPGAWERPPEEQEKPKPKEVSAPKDEKSGDGRPWLAGIDAGWGFGTDRSNGGLVADPYGLAMGARGGYSWDFNLYTGLFFQYYLGSSREGGQQRSVGGTSTTTSSYMQFGAEVGYDAWAGPVILRPSLQFGAALAFTDLSYLNSPVGAFMLGPGLDVIYPIDGWYLGGELRPSIVLGDGPSGLLLALNGGLRFE